MDVWLQNSVLVDGGKIAEHISFSTTDHTTSAERCKKSAVRIPRSLCIVWLMSRDDGMKGSSCLHFLGMIEIGYLKIPRS